MKKHMNFFATKNPVSGKPICAPWAAHLFDNALRRRMHPPHKILGPFVRPGMTVLDMGCGFGHFSLGMARLVGPEGRVFAADVQHKMLDKTMSRAKKAGLDDIVIPWLCGATLGLGAEQGVQLDFALASNVLHELDDTAAFLAELVGLMRPGGLAYVMEPAGHVTPERLEGELKMARDAGFTVVDRPELTRERCAILAAPDTKEA